MERPSRRSALALGTVLALGLTLAAGTTCSPSGQTPPPFPDGGDPGALRCGGQAGTLCPSGMRCMDDPSDTCDPSRGGADCPGTCVADTTGQHQSCGGNTGLTCPTGYDCVDDPNDSCVPGTGPANCPGICMPAGQPANQCSSNQPCPTGERCVPDPSQGCDVTVDRECTGLCAALNPNMPRPCGGFSGIGCPDGYVCVDNPDDGCDPKSGATDCDGFCMPGQKSNQCTNDDCGKIPPNTVQMCMDGTIANPTCHRQVSGDCVWVISQCPQTIFCGGPAGKTCPEGFVCIDNPSDTCKPQDGGAGGCPGTCRKI